MRPNNDVRDRLLSHLPAAADLAAYRKEVAATLEKNQKRIRLERILATLFWIFCAVTAAIYIWFGNNGSQFPRAPFLACIFLLLGGVEILKHHIHSAQVELQKEVKQLQVQVLELQSSIAQQRTGSMP
jgi:hypothetical protein